MKSFTRLSLSLGLLTTLASAIAAPKAEALPWADANPQAQAAAEAYADAYAEAIAIGHPDPEAFALAASADDCATIACHASCGLLIMAGSACSENSENNYAGPYNNDCLCASDSQFMKYYPACMDCGWTLWKYYGGYVSSALEACSTIATEPTGTSRCSTTLTDSYTIDTSIQGCEYLGNCPTTTSSTTATSSSTSTSSSSTAVSSTSTSSSSTSTSSTSSSSTSTSAATTSSSSTGTYTATTNTVTTDLSFTYSYDPSQTTTTDCFTTSYDYPVATNNPIDITFESWDDKVVVNGTTTYTTYFFFKFNEDQSLVSDIRLITGTTRPSSVLKPESEVWINLEQGLLGYATGSSNSQSAYNLEILVTYDGTNYLYAYSCTAGRLNMQYMRLDASEYSSCFKMGYWAFWDNNYCSHRDEAFTTTVEFRGASTASAASSTSAASSSSIVSSSSAAESSESSTDSLSSTYSSASSSAVESSVENSSSVEASSSATSSAVQSSSDSSAASSAELSSVISSEASSAVSSEASSAVSSDASSAVSSESSAASSESSVISSEASSAVSSESSVASSESSVASSESSVASSESSVASSGSSIASSSSSSSSASASATEEPTLDGELVDSAPQWTLTIPASLGPWTSVSLQVSRSGSNFNYDNAAVQVNGEAQDVSASVSDDSITLTFDFTVESSDILEIIFDGVVSGAGSFTSDAELTIITPDGQKLVKRAESSWSLSNTIDVDASSSSSSSAVSSAGSSSAAVSSAGSSSAAISSGFTNSTSTEIVGSESTTLVTVTSCDATSCSAVESTAQVSIATSTINGVVTSYTTYCPLSTTTTTTSEPSTTLVTITSCSEDKCTAVESTAQISVGTTTINGVITSYTTYCPLTTSTGAEDSTTTEKSTKVITVSSCSNGKCSEVVSTDTSEGITSYITQYVTSYYTSVSEGTTITGAVTSAEIVAPTTGLIGTTSIAESSESVGSTTAGVSTFEGSASRLVGTGLIGLLFVLFI